MRSFFITIEGMDGSGKSTIIPELAERLEKTYSGQNVVATKEPGGTTIGDDIRKILLDVKNNKIDIRTEVLLFAASRRQHVVEKIIPTLKSGGIVISDRFLDSSIVYQGAGRGIGMQDVAELNEFAVEGLRPDITLYLKINPVEGLKRIKTNRKDDIDRMDREQQNFYFRVSHAYNQVIEKDSERFVIVNADQPIERVVDEAWDKLVNRMNTIEKNIGICGGNHEL